jgi:hypothetical protein
VRQRDRQARFERAKAIGRIAFTHVRDGQIIGNAPVDGEMKRLTEYEDSIIAIELAAPFRLYARSDKFSRLRVHGEKVFEIRRDKAGGKFIITTMAIGSERCATGRRRSHSIDGRALLAAGVSCNHVAYAAKF